MWSRILFMAASTSDMERGRDWDTPTSLLVDPDITLDEK